MSKTIVAIIGCGTIANSAPIPAYVANPDAEIKYFCDIRKERAEKAADQYGCGEAIEDYRIILEDPEVEAVSICTPNNCHALIAIDCMRAGKHVLCEKPAARTYEEALEMQKVQHETGKTLNIGVVNRFNTGVNIIKKMIEEGELGDLYHVYVSFRSHRSIPGLGGDFTNKAVAGGGALIDWGVHFLDIVMYCAGDPDPKTVTGQTYSKLGKDMKNYSYINMWAGPPNYEGTYDVDDFVTAMIRTAGPSITVNGAWAQNIGVNEMYIDFLGDKAGIRLQYGADFTIYSAKHGALLESNPKFAQTDQFQNEIDSFLSCIKSGEKLPSHIDTVILTAKIIQAIYQSSEQRTEISFVKEGALA
ncbi:Gfo/Idh/MocA family protein [Paenibacillus apiarius]|uniref:Gfo/Idh/MocA family oxidoreductase n=1 Tax=Paenibacillus apiarius TaxID=46240 RepID=A0ABT4DQF3_9BACL|nr:Gfo/Idh/MocA family oxidoreductase [Paenibacillus apiarius]MCY9514037.1 Gfo/Idh/MocA family oxidoreductase [Paenibacillus apiarius]MCY9519554.1 Gfo/Idh/MocA family oxidoreductase [Paenibacillus apiarius]MCY9552481.1 Gfo/Idh/MocA family oxidoreductase [Paenibacillus apiarius]MCY9556310.1 Gfo/Idh/MocA family oxidoreductase [Paenibacillus apiarius]MCY9681844.1 Gfo/Idh/MocA family oxidoreductase [Paenibacillus apiarius]